MIRQNIGSDATSLICSNLTSLDQLANAQPIHNSNSYVDELYDDSDEEECNILINELFKYFCIYNCFKTKNCVVDGI